jgi:hypothetical protein
MKNDQKGRFDMKLRRLFVIGGAFLMLANLAVAQITPSEESLSGLYPGKSYSPHAQRSFPSRPLWGDTHLHTALSVDAGLFGARLGLEEAYRFARGEEVTSSTGQPVKLSRPLDWLVVADHSDALGFVQDLAAGAPGILAFEEGRRWHAGLEQGGDAAVAATLDLITTFAQGKIPEALMADYSPGAKKYRAVWEHVVKAVEEYNEPGRFTGFRCTAATSKSDIRHH